MILGQPLFEEFASVMNAHGVRYLIVGGLAVVIHGYMRTTGDVDLWVENTNENISRMKDVFLEMGYSSVQVDDATNHYKEGKKVTVYLDADSEIPIEFMPIYATSVSFEKAWEIKEQHAFGGTFVNVVDVDTLLDMKIRAGREQDLRDVLELKKRNNLL
ncbi:MAG: nucleotidyltransferase [Salibacteraceae bacterium]